LGAVNAKAAAATMQPRKTATTVRRRFQMRAKNSSNRTLCSQSVF